MKLKPALILITPLLAFNAFASPGAASITPPSEDVETITVIGERPLLYYRGLMNKEEKAFYKLYNAYTTDRDMKIKCTSETDSTRVQFRKCEPQFVKRLRHSLLSKEQRYDTEDNLVKMFISKKPISAIMPELKKLKAKQLAHVEGLVRQHPELQLQLAKYVEKKELYERKKEEKFKDGYFADLFN